jgi:hypothetical protein
VYNKHQGRVTGTMLRVESATLAVWQSTCRSSEPTFLSDGKLCHRSVTRRFEPVVYKLKHTSWTIGAAILPGTKGAICGTGKTITPT